MEAGKRGDAAPRAGDATVPASATLPAGAAAWPQPEPGGFGWGSTWRVLNQPGPLHGSCREPQLTHRPCTSRSAAGLGETIKYPLKGFAERT